MQPPDLKQEGAASMIWRTKNGETPSRGREVGVAPRDSRGSASREEERPDMARRDRRERVGDGGEERVGRWRFVAPHVPVRVCDLLAACIVRHLPCLRGVRVGVRHFTMLV